MAQPPQPTNAILQSF